MDESSDRHRRCHSCCLTAPSLTSTRAHTLGHTWSLAGGGAGGGRCCRPGLRLTLVLVVGRTGWDPRSEQLSAGPHDPGWPGLQVDETERQNTKSAQMSTNWEAPCSKIHKDRCARLCISFLCISFHDVSQPVDRWWQGANIQDSSSNSPHLRPLDFVLQFLVPLLLFCFP